MACIIMLTAFPSAPGHSVLQNVVEKRQDLWSSNLFKSNTHTHVYIYNLIILYIYIKLGSLWIKCQMWATGMNLSAAPAPKISSEINRSECHTPERRINPTGPKIDGFLDLATVTSKGPRSVWVKYAARNDRNWLVDDHRPFSCHVIYCDKFVICDVIRS
jgi:hypothetical protein